MTDKTKTPECNHRGHIRSAGVIPIRGKEGMLLLIVMLCSECGSVMVKDLKLPGINKLPPTMGMKMPQDFLKKIKKQ